MPPFDSSPDDHCSCYPPGTRVHQPPTSRVPLCSEARQSAKCLQQEYEESAAAEASSAVQSKESKLKLGLMVFPRWDHRWYHSRRSRMAPEQAGFASPLVITLAWSRAAMTGSFLFLHVHHRSYPPRSRTAKPPYPPGEEARLATRAQMIVALLYCGLHHMFTLGQQLHRISGEVVLGPQTGVLLCHGHGFQDTFPLPLSWLERRWSSSNESSPYSIPSGSFMRGLAMVSYLSSLSAAQWMESTSSDYCKVVPESVSVLFPDHHRC